MCTDEVDETSGIFKWNKRATDEMKKLNIDCNLTAGLEAVLQVAVGAHVMLRRIIDTSTWLVNGALCTVISIKAHHIGVQFDNIHTLPSGKSEEQVHGHKENICTPDAVSTDPGIHCHHTQVPGSVIKLRHDGPV